MCSLFYPSGRIFISLFDFFQLLTFLIKNSLLTSTVNQQNVFNVIKKMIYDEQKKTFQKTFRS